MFGIIFLIAATAVIVIVCLPTGQSGNIKTVEEPAAVQHDKTIMKYKHDHIPRVCPECGGEDCFSSDRCEVCGYRTKGV